MAFDTNNKPAERSRPPLGPVGADVDEDGVPLDPGAPPTKDLHLRVNAYEHHWLRKIVDEDMSSLQRVGRLALREKIRRYQTRKDALPKTGT